MHVSEKIVLAPPKINCAEEQKIGLYATVSSLSDDLMNEADGVDGQ